MPSECKSGLKTWIASWWEFESNESKVLTSLSASVTKRSVRPTDAWCVHAMAYGHLISLASHNERYLINIEAPYSLRMFFLQKACTLPRNKSFGLIFRGEVLAYLARRLLGRRASYCGALCSLSIHHFGKDTSHVPISIDRKRYWSVIADYCVSCRSVRSGGTFCPNSLKVACLDCFTNILGFYNQANMFAIAW